MILYLLCCSLSVSHGYGLQVKEIRNNIFHSATFKLSHYVLERYIKDMTTLLHDPTQLLTDPNAMWAVIQLNKVTQSLQTPHIRCF